MLSDYDKRQLNLMREQLCNFREGNLSIQGLISNVEGLINALENIDEVWIDKCRGFWWDIEQVYAVALDREKKSFDQYDSEIITKALKGIENLLDQILYPSEE